MIAISIQTFTVHKYICRKIKDSISRVKSSFFPHLQVVHWVALSSLWLP